MPAALTYPGVYIEEVPSPVHTIAGVSTATTAFLGYTAKGPVSRATKVYNFSEFERTFGGLTDDSEVAYAVQQYFLNGGTEAWIVRMANGAQRAAVTLQNQAGDPATVATARPALVVSAKSEGGWGNLLRVDVDFATSNPDSLFALTVTEYRLQLGAMVPLRQERHANLSMDPNSDTYAPLIVNDASDLVDVADAPGIPATDNANYRGGSVSGDLSAFPSGLDEKRFITLVLDGDRVSDLQLWGSAAAPTQLGTAAGVAALLQSAVRAARPASNLVFQNFTATVVGNRIELISGGRTRSSHVRVFNASTGDAAAALKLGLANGGREREAAAFLRPLPTGTLSTDDLDTVTWPGGSRTLKVIATPAAGAAVTGVIAPLAASAPASLESLRAGLEARIRALGAQGGGPDVAHAFPATLRGGQHASSTVDQAEPLNGVFLLPYTSGAAGSSLRTGMAPAQQPDVPRSVVVTAKSVGVESLVANELLVEGTDQFGNPQQERITIPNVAMAAAQHRCFVGSRVFATVTRLTLEDADQATIQFGVGLGTLLGLPKPLATPGAADVATLTLGGADVKASSDIDAARVAVRPKPNPAPVNLANDAVVAVTYKTTWNPLFRNVFVELAGHQLLAYLRSDDPGVLLSFADVDAGNDLASLLSLDDPEFTNVQEAEMGRPGRRGARVYAQAGDDGVPHTDAGLLGNANAGTGLYALDKTDIFNLLCIPKMAEMDDGNHAAVAAQAAAYCQLRRSFLIVDPPLKTKETFAKLQEWHGKNLLPKSPNAAVYYPWVKVPDPLNRNRPADFPASGTLAGLYARTDAVRGVWKAPAGTEATLTNVQGLSCVMTDMENGAINQLGVNALRQFPVIGNVAWGTRTLLGADEQASEWKYVPIRRLALFIEESLYRGTKWVVFEPNDEPLWSRIRLNVGSFMHDLFRKGAFQGGSPKQAYFVKCDGESTTQSDIDKGIVNILVGFAPLKPAEFVVIKISQMRPDEA